MSETVIHKISHLIPVSRELLDNSPADIFAVVAQRVRVHTRQGSRCFATTRAGRRCSRTWKVVVSGEVGYCRQHARAVSA